MEKRVWFFSDYGRRPESEAVAALALAFHLRGFRVRIVCTNDNPGRVRPAADSMVTRSRRVWGKDLFYPGQDIAIFCGERSARFLRLFRDVSSMAPTFLLWEPSQPVWDPGLRKWIWSVITPSGHSLKRLTHGRAREVCHLIPPPVNLPKMDRPPCIVFPLMHADVHQVEMASLYALFHALSHSDCTAYIVAGPARVCRKMLRNLQRLADFFPGRVTVSSRRLGNARFDQFAQGDVLFWPLLSDPFVVTPWEAVACGVKVVGFDLPELLELRSCGDIYLAPLRQSGRLNPNYDVLAESLLAAVQSPLQNPPEHNRLLRKYVQRQLDPFLRWL